MNIKQNVKTQPILTEREKLERKYASARSSLLTVVIFTLVNMIFAITGSGTYFLFSASVPYFLTMLGSMLQLRPEVACENLGYAPGSSDYNEIMSLHSEGVYAIIFGIFLTISVISLVLYFVSWLLSKKKSGWMIFALVLFIVDTIGMIALMGIALESAMDVVFHIYVLVCLIIGISAAAKLKKLPPEEEAPVDFTYAAPADEVVDPGFSYPDNATPTLNGESINTKNEN